MSIHDQPPVQKQSVPVESMPSWPHTKEDTVVPAPEHRDDKHDKRFGKRAIASLVGGAMALGAGAFGYNALKSDGDKDPVKTADPAPELVLGPDGEPLQYVEWDHDAHIDRNNDGTNDGATDVDNDGVIDAEELWDQENKEFVDPKAEDGEEVLANATEEDLSNIAEIETTFPEFWESNPHWREDFVKLDPLVKDRVMVAVHSPEDYSGTDILTPEQQWEASVQDQFNRTPEDISN